MKGGHHALVSTLCVRKPLRSFFFIKNIKVLRIPIINRIFASCYYAHNEYEDNLFTKNLNKILSV